MKVKARIRRCRLPWSSQPAPHHSTSPFDLGQATLGLVRLMSSRTSAAIFCRLVTSPSPAVQRWATGRFTGGRYHLPLAITSPAGAAYNNAFIRRRQSPVSCHHHSARQLWLVIHPRQQ